MKFRIITYIAFLVFGMLVGVIEYKAQQKQILRTEREYLFNTVEAKLRINAVDLRIVERKLAELAETLGSYNDELNPYQ